MEIDKQSVGQRLKYKRQEKGMTLEQVAQYVGAYSRATVGNWEKGKTLPKYHFLEKFSVLFGVSIDWIKYGELTDYIYNILDREMKEKYKSLFNTPIYKKFNGNELDIFSYISDKSTESLINTSNINEDIFEESQNAIKRDELYSKISTLSTQMANDWGERKKERYPNKEDIKNMYLSLRYRSDDTLKTLIDFDDSLINFLSYQENILKRMVQISDFENSFEYMFLNEKNIEDIKKYKSNLSMLITELNDLRDSLNNTLTQNDKYQFLQQYNNHRDEEN